MSKIEVDKPSSTPFPHQVTEQKPYFYRAYGLRIKSDVRLPELEPAANGPVDVSIILTTMDIASAVKPVNTFIEFGEAEQILAWQQVGIFRIVGTDTIFIDPADGVDEQLIAFPLLGPVFAYLLHLRNLLVLHASAVSVGDGSAILLGDKGAGKSTTAGALVAAGHKLMSDDVVAINFTDPDHPMVEPAFPQMKLLEDAASALSLPAAEVRPTAHPAIDKLQHLLSGSFCNKSTPPTRLYVLDRGESPAIEALPLKQALNAIIRYSYITRFSSAALKPAAAATHFKNSAKIANICGVSRLQVPVGLHRIDEAIQLIRSDIECSHR